MRKKQRSQPAGDGSPKLTRLKLTALIGALIVLTSALCILWVLGGLPYIWGSVESTQHSVQIVPDCTVDSGAQIELEIHSLDQATLEIYVNTQEEDSGRCNEIIVYSSYDLRVQEAIGFDVPLITNTEEEPPGEGTDVSFDRETYSLEGEKRYRFAFPLDQGEYPKSVFLKFDFDGVVSAETFSEGEVEAVFIVNNIVSMPLSFLVVLHGDIRVTSRDIDAEYDDPRSPNIYRYRASSFDGASVVPVRFGVDSRDRDRVKETLLVVFSAIFGVGISGLFESFLASEIYSVVAASLFGLRRATSVGSESTVRRLGSGTGWSGHEVKGNVRRRGFGAAIRDRGLAGLGMGGGALEKRAEGACDWGVHVKG